MCAVLIGGIDRLKADYRKAAVQAGFRLKCISRNERNIGERIGQPDVIIIFTNMVSHEARNKAVRHASEKGIPCRLVHACGVSSLKQELKSHA